MTAMDLTYTELRRLFNRLQRIEATTKLILHNQGIIMATIAQIKQDLADTKDIVHQLVGFIQNNDAEKATLRQQIADLVAKASLDQAAKDALQAEIDSAFDAAEDLENTARAGLPGVPPVGGTPLNQSYTDGASFDSAVAAYTGPEAVNKDGIEVKAGTSPALEYYSHSADGSVNTTSPTD